MKTFPAALDRVEPRKAPRSRTAGSVSQRRKHFQAVLDRTIREEAGDRTRTGNIQLGRLMLYQLSYTRAAVA